MASKIIRTHRVQDIVSIWYVESRKCCVLVESQVKIWSCTLSYKNCHFGTILTIFAKFEYYFDGDKFGDTTLTFKKLRIMSLSHPH